MLDCYAISIHLHGNTHIERSLDEKRNVVLRQDNENSKDGACKQRVCLQEYGHKNNNYIHNQEETAEIYNEDGMLGKHKAP